MLGHYALILLGYYRPIPTVEFTMPIDITRIWYRVYGFGRFVLRRLVDDRCLQVAGSLTFTTLLAIVPLFTITLTLFSAFPMFSVYSTRFKAFLISNLVPDASGRVIGTYMRQFSDNAERLTALGMISLAVTALLLLFTIEKTLNQIWRVRRNRNLLARTLIYWAGLTLGPLLIALSISLTSWLVTSASAHTLLSSLTLFLLKLAPWLLMLVSLTLLYLTVPNCYVPRSHALASAAFTVLVLECMKKLFAIYVKQFASFKLVYGAFSSFPIFLLWIYSGWIIILGGAVLSACLSYWHNDGWRKMDHQGTRLEMALQLLDLLAGAHRAGQILHIDDLRRKAGLGIDLTYQLLESMAVKGWVSSTREGGWILACSLDQIKMIEVFEQVVVPLQVEKEGSGRSCIEHLRAVLAQSVADYLSDQAIPLAAKAALTVSSDKVPT